MPNAADLSIGGHMQENKELKRLMPRHFEIMKLCLQGMTARDIATTMGMSVMGISLITNSPLFQDEIARRRENQDKNRAEIINQDALSILESASVDAARKQVELLTSKSEKIALASSNSILDRVLDDKSAQSGNVVMLSEGALKVLQLTINEIKDSGHVEKELKVEREDIDITEP